MRQDLLAPPKLTVRVCARIIAACCLFAIVIGVFLAACGLIGMRDLVIRAAISISLGAATVWLYSRLKLYAKRARPERMPLIHATAGVICLFSFYVSIGIVLYDTAFGGAMSGMIWAVPFMFGGMLIGGGVARRVGDTLHCPKCEYEFTFGDSPDAPIRCPECGRPWIGLLKKGRRMRSPRMIVAGIVIATASVVVFNPIFYLATIPGVLPTPVLFASLYVMPRGGYFAWNEMAKRQLGPEWTRIMAGRVLDQRRTTNGFENGPSQWFEGMVGAGSIPADLVERYYSEGFGAELRVPRRAKAGEPFGAALRVTHVAPDGKTDVGVMFAGYAVDDEPASIGRQKKMQWAFELRPGMFERHRDVLEETLRVDRPGEVRVRAVYWVVYQPSFMDELSWQADGSPVKPSKAVWFERFEVEKTVHVE